MAVQWRQSEELDARRKAWVKWAEDRYENGEAPPMSPREAYFAGWKDRAEWGYQELPSGDAA